MLAALGLFALTELRYGGYDLRSRCSLVLDGTPPMEIVKRDGTTEPFVLDQGGAKSLLDAALQQATAKGLAWRRDLLRLTPSAALVDLLVKSRELGTVEADGDEDAEEEEETGQGTSSSEE